MVSKRRIAAADSVDLEQADGASPGLDPIDAADGPREPDEPEAFGPDDEVLEAQLVGPQFTVDTVVARLASEGVFSVRSSPFLVNVEAGPMTRLGQHTLLFRADDRDAVGQALRDAGLL